MGYAEINPEIPVDCEDKGFFFLFQYIYISEMLCSYGYSGTQADGGYTIWSHLRSRMERRQDNLVRIS